jgi:hypothetical protein
MLFYLSEGTKTRFLGLLLDEDLLHILDAGISLL